MANINKIVRIHNKEISACVTRIAAETGAPFQFVFDVWCEMVVEQYLFGDETHQILFNRVVSEIAKYDI